MSKLIKRKSLTTLLLLIGMALSYFSIKYIHSGFVRYIGAVIGGVLMCIGGYAAQARMLKIEPFEDSYRKARETYTDGEDKNDQSK